MTNPLLVGVDVHRKTNTACGMNLQGQEVTSRFTVDNNRPGTQAFVEEVAKQVVEGNFDAIHIAAEATGLYWWHFLQTLDQDPLLNQWPMKLYPVNPRLTANFRKTYGDQDKDDPIDAFVIADRLRMGRDLPTPFHGEERYFALRLLTRYRFHLVHALAREKTYCLTVLYLKASEYTRLKPFSNVFGAASRAVLQDFTSIEEIAAIPFDQLVEFIDTKGKRRFPNPNDNARTLQQVTHDSYPLPQALQQPVNIILGMSLQHISFMERQCKRLDTAIKDQIQPIPHTLNSIPGFGPVFSGGILSEIGDIQRFHHNQAKVAKFAGLKWKHAKSAEFEAEETPLTRTGNRYLRYYFCEAANTVRMRDPDYAAYYKRKYNEVRKHQHKRAIVLTARKLVRLVVALLSTNQPYQTRRP